MPNKVFSCVCFPLLRRCVNSIIFNIFDLIYLGIFLQILATLSKDTGSTTQRTQSIKADSKGVGHTLFAIESDTRSVTIEVCRLISSPVIKVLTLKLLLTERIVACVTLNAHISYSVDAIMNLNPPTYFAVIRDLQCDIGKTLEKWIPLYPNIFY